MFAKGRLLILAAFALLSILAGASVQATIIPGAPIQQQPRPLPQDPNTVSIQTPGASARGRPAVIVSVDKSRVRVNELVRFTLSPASLVTNPKFVVTIDFGDGTKVVTRQASITYRYDATGHYDVHASAVGPDELRVPSVTLIARPTEVRAGNPVSFSAQLSFRYPGIKYRFAFGDGSQTDWQDAAYTSHSYAVGGKYLSYVDLGIASSGGIKQVGGSLRQPIVVSGKDPDPPDPGPVQLTANPTPVQTGKPVTFTARVASTNPDIRYRFVFGDGVSDPWQESSQARHAYATPGNYSASVTMGLASNRTIRPLSSAQQAVQVTKAAQIEVVLSANPNPAEKGQPVTFNAGVSSPLTNIRYRFVFGDGSSPTDWQTDSQTTHTYAAAGDYPARVEIGRWNNRRVVPTATSNTKTISVTSAVPPPTPTPTPTASPTPTPEPSPSGGPTPSPQPSSSNGPTPAPSATSSPGVIVGPVSPDYKIPLLDKLPVDWWVYLLILLLLIFVAYQLYRSLFVPRASLHPNRDMGSSEVDTAAAAKGLSITSQVLMRPNVSEGQYSVDTNEDNIVRSVRRENV